MLILLVMPFFLPFCFFTGRHLGSLKQRFGIFEKSFISNSHYRIWFHAASVGEVQVAKALINELTSSNIQAEYIVTTVTEQGLDVAKKYLGNQAFCLFAPIDLPWIIKRYIHNLQPSIYICLETDLWPNIIRMTSSQGIKALLLNGRMTEKSYKRYNFFRRFTKQVLGCFSSVSTIKDIDRNRYISLGVESSIIFTHGNAKYDLPPDSQTTGSQQTSHLGSAKKNKTASDTNIEYRKELGISQNQPVFVAGSTHTGEENKVLSAYKILKEQLPDLILIIAPRHIIRLGSIEMFFDRLQVKYTRLSSARNGDRDSDVILVDTMGELTRLYSLATYVFCGGSLVEKGGHNIMEPAAWGKAPFYGPHMKDFTDARMLLESKNAGFTVHTVQELVDIILHFSENKETLKTAGEMARTVAKSQFGSAKKQTRLITQALIN